MHCGGMNFNSIKILPCCQSFHKKRLAFTHFSCKVRWIPNDVFLFCEIWSLIIWCDIHKANILTVPSSVSLRQEPKSASRMCPFTSSRMLSGLMSLSERKQKDTLIYIYKYVYVNIICIWRKLLKDSKVEALNPGHTDYFECKVSYFWIKVSAKCININVNIAVIVFGLHGSNIFLRHVTACCFILQP